MYHVHIWQELDSWFRLQSKAAPVYLLKSMAVSSVLSPDGQALLLAPHSHIHCRSFYDHQLTKPHSDGCDTFVSRTAVCPLADPSFSVSILSCLQSYNWIINADPGGGQSKEKFQDFFSILIDLYSLNPATCHSWIFMIGCKRSWWGMYGMGGIMAC